MAVDLDAALLAAQTAQSRRPIISLIAGKAVPDIPFTGNPLANPAAVDQGTSFSVFLPGGEFAIFYTANNTSLRMVKTDSELTAFEPYVSIVSTAAIHMDGVLLSTGIGLAVLRSTTNLTFYRVSEAGALLGSTSVTLTADATGCTVCETDTGYACIVTRFSEGVSYIELRTSSDFITWSAATALTISGHDSTMNLKDPRIAYLDDGTYMLLISVVTIQEGDSEVYNLKYSTSADLSTWSAFTALTSSVSAATNYTYPDIVQKADGSLFVSSQEEVSYLMMTRLTDGWDSDLEMNPFSIWVDEINGKAYFHSFYNYSGTSYLGSAQVDIDTWSIEKFFSKSTIPAVPEAMPGLTGSRHIGSGPLGCFGNGDRICVIDFQNDVIRAFYGNDYSATYGSEAAKNIDLPGRVLDTFVVDNKLWLGMYRTSYGQFNDKPTVGYIDLDQVTAPYECVTVCNFSDPAGFTLGTRYRFAIYPEENICLACGAHDSYLGAIFVGDMETDSLLKDYRRSNYSEFPSGGVFDAVLVDGRIYASVNYTTTYAAESHKWGLMEIDMVTDSIQYHHPPWETTPRDCLAGITVNEELNELTMNIPEGAATYNYVSGQWNRWHPDVFPGLPDFTAWSGAAGHVAAMMKYPIGFDTSRDIFLGHGGGAFYLIPRSGTAKNLEYQGATHDGSDWTFSEASRLVIGYRHQDLVISLSPEKDIFATWTNLVEDEDRVMWDKNQSAMDLAEYLIGETQFQYQIDAPARLTFTLSHGHLFDPANANSMLATTVKKSRLVTCKMGEKISGVDTWMDHGKFLVRYLDIKYERDAYPSIKVVCEDLRCMWDMNKVTAAVVTNLAPETALSNIIQNNTSLTSSDLSIPTLTGSFNFTTSWMDQFLSDIVDDVAHRFEHFVTVDHDNIVTFRPITRSGTSARTISRSEIISYSSDDRYSDLTNRITVTGLSLYDFLITHAEERIGQLSGTVGWWGFDKDFYVYWSKDESKRCKNVRLQVIETSTSIMFKLAGDITEGISYTDPFDKYCVVEIKAPNLVPVLIAFIAVYVAGTQVGDIAPTTGGMTIPVGRLMEKVGIYGALMVLASVGNFKYELHGQPVGYIKRQYSGTANDTELQQELGEIIENKFDGFLCHTASHCEAVAEFEMMIAQGQRNRVKATKTAHLQDEIGDTLTITHPYTESAVKMFITNLTRKYKPGKDDGYFIDDIEGWIC